MKYLGAVLLFLLIGVSGFAQAIQEDMLLAEGLSDDDPRVFMESLIAVEKKAEYLRQSIASMTEAEYERIRREFEARYRDIDRMEPYLWETDGEFALRIRSERKKLQEEMEQRKLDAEMAVSGRDVSMLNTLEHLLDRADARYWEGWDVPAEYLVLEMGEYDRNQRLWHFAVGSVWEQASFAPVDVTVCFNEVLEDPERDMVRELGEFAEAVSSDALTVEASWALDREFVPLVFHLHVVNSLNGMRYPVVHCKAAEEQQQEEEFVLDEPEEEAEEIPALLPPEVKRESPVREAARQEVSLGFTLGMLVDRESESARVISRVRPMISSETYEFGFQFLIHQDTAIELGSSFMSDRSGLLQFIDHFSVGREGDAVRFSGGSREPFTLGSGTVITRLSPLGEAPELRRVPAVAEVPFGTVFVDDLAAPSLAGLRVGFSGVQVSAGAGAVMDFGVQGSTPRQALVPFADLRFQLSDMLTLEADSAAMMIIGEGPQFITESFYAPGSGFYNFFVRLGAEAQLGDVTLRGNASAGRGELLPGLYGWQHYRYRSSMIDHLFDDSVIGTSAFSLSVHGEALYRGSFFEAASHVRFPLMQLGRSLLGAEVRIDGGKVSFTAGGEGNPFDLLSDEVSLYGRASYRSGDAEVSFTAAASPKGFSHIALETAFSAADGSAAARRGEGTASRFFGEVSQGFSGDFSGGTFYGITSVSAGYDAPSFGFALGSRFIYEGDPFLWDTLYDVRKEQSPAGLWNMGRGLTGFASVMDIAYDLLSLVSRVRIGAPGDGLFLSAGHRDAYRMGTGIILRDLDPMSDLPMITRVPLLLEAGGDSFGLEFFLDDITFPVISSVRVSLSTSGDHPMEFGAGAAADFGNIRSYVYPFGDSVHSAADMVRKTLFMPFADARVPVYRTGDFTAEAAGSFAMLIPIDQDLQVGGFSRYSIFAGARFGFSDELFIHFGPSAVRGELRPGLMGREYYRHRDDVVSGVMGSSSDDLSLSPGLFTEVLYCTEGAEVSFYADLPLNDVSSGSMGLRGALRALSGEISAGASTPPGVISLGDSRFFVQGTWDAGAVEVTGSFSGGAGAPAVYKVEASVSHNGWNQR